MSRINYDNLIHLHETKSDSFYKEAQGMLERFLPDSQTHKYEPEVLVSFLGEIVPFLSEFITILEHKKQNKNHVILDVLQIFH